MNKPFIEKKALRPPANGKGSGHRRASRVCQARATQAASRTMPGGRCTAGKAGCRALPPRITPRGLPAMRAAARDAQAPHGQRGFRTGCVDSAWDAQAPHGMRKLRAGCASSARTARVPHGMRGLRTDGTGSSHGQRKLRTDNASSARTTRTPHGQRGFRMGCADSARTARTPHGMRAAARDAQAPHGQRGFRPTRGKPSVSPWSSRR